MTIPEPEHAARGETEVEITDLDSGKVAGSSTRRSRGPTLRARAWMSLAMIAGIALLVVTVLVSVLHLPKAARVTAPPVHINYPVSLSVVDGICYASSPNGVVTALRVSDGSLLWRYTPHVSARQLAPVVGDDLVLIALQDGSIDALRASSGALRWHRAMNS